MSKTLLLRWPLIRLTRSVLALCLCLLALNARGAVDDNTASMTSEQLLARVNNAVSSTRFQGLLAYDNRDQLVSMRVYHGVIDGAERQRLEYLDGEPREVVRVGEQVNCIHMKQGQLKFNAKNLAKAMPSINKIADPNLAAMYEFKMVGVGRVAGQDTIEIALIPRDQYRYQQNVSIHADKYVPLKSETIDRKSRVLERFQFVEIDFSGEFDDDLLNAQLMPAKDVDAQLRTDADRSEQQAASAAKHWQIAWMPEQFSLRRQQQAVRGMGTRIYSDGLASFSVFVESMDEQRPMMSRMQRGASVVYSRTLVNDARVYRVTVVGEVPLHTAERIAASVRLSNP